MRRNALISAFLVIVLATAAFGCVSDWSGKPSSSCNNSSIQKPCVRKPGTAVAKRSGCGDNVKSVPGLCNVRGFAQFQFTEFRKFEIAGPLRQVEGRISRPRNAAILVSSIGSPETDRGPPTS